MSHVNSPKHVLYPKLFTCGNTHISDLFDPSELISKIPNIFVGLIRGKVKVSDVDWNSATHTLVYRQRMYTPART